MLQITIDDKTVDRVLVWVMYLQLVILEFFGLGNMLNKIISVVILLRIVSRYGGFAIRQRVSFLAVCSLLLYLVSGIFSSDTDLSVLYGNLLNIVYPMIYSFYIYILFRCQSEMMDQFIEKGAWVFNLTMIVNFFVLYRQIAVPYSINAVPIRTEIGYYADLISGLFQYASTHVVCLFTSFIVVYNLARRKRYDNMGRKMQTYIFVLAVIIISAAIALQSDNKALFFVMPLIIIVYFWLLHAGNGSGGTLKVISGICFVFVLIVVLYIMIPSVHNFLDDNVLSMFDLVSSAYRLGNSANGSSERIAMLIYALNEASTWFFGKGFGSAGIYTSGYLGFAHFGQSDLTIMLILGGFWYTFILVWFYISMFTQIVGGECRLAGIQRAGMVALFLCVAMYTHCMTTTNTAICMMLIVSAYRSGFRNTTGDISDIEQRKDTG